MVGISRGAGDPRLAEALEPAAHPSPVTQTPAVDIYEGPEGLVLEADLPGATEQQVNIQLEDNVLVLESEVTSPLDSGVRALHEEFPIPRVFHRSFILSDEVDRGRISAELRSGVLKIVLPKAERLVSRKIEIKGQ